MGNYQDRKDIDRLYDELYSQFDGSLNVVKFKDNSPYKNISYDMDGDDMGTIDAILDYYGLTEGGGGGGDLSNYYTKSEINSILSSYVTTETIEDYQPLLESGVNIKTINNQSLLGEGNIDIQGGGGSVIGTGSFSINNQGHLIVELPNAVDNPYFIDNQGHLIYDTSNTHNGS